MFAVTIDGLLRLSTGTSVRVPRIRVLSGLQITRPVCTLYGFEDKTRAVLIESDSESNEMMSLRSGT